MDSDIVQVQVIAIIKPRLHFFSLLFSLSNVTTLASNHQHAAHLHGTMSAELTQGKHKNTICAHFFEKLSRSIA